MDSLKTITISGIPDASIEFASELKNGIGWLDTPEEIQRIPSHPSAQIISAKSKGPPDVSHGRVTPSFISFEI